MMKKIMMTAVFAVAIFASTQMNAQKTDKEAQVESVEVQEASPMQDEFKQVEMTKVPAVVKRMVSKNFKNAKITKAFVNAKKEYKIQLTDADGEQQAVFVNEKGEMLKK